MIRSEWVAYPSPENDGTMIVSKFLGNRDRLQGLGMLKHDIIDPAIKQEVGKIWGDVLTEARGVDFPDTIYSSIEARLAGKPHTADELFSISMVIPEKNVNLLDDILRRRGASGVTRLEAPAPARQR